MNNWFSKRLAEVSKTSSVLSNIASFCPHHDEGGVCCNDKSINFGKELIPIPNGCQRLPYICEYQAKKKVQKLKGAKETKEFCGHCKGTKKVYITKWNVGGNDPNPLNIQHKCSDCGNWWFTKTK